MLETNAYAYLNIDDPVCAWCAYRSVLVSASVHSERGFTSVWSAAIIRADDPARLSRESILESARFQRYGDRVSRLGGMYCFLDIESANRAAAVWGGRAGTYFRTENLVEISLQGGSRRDRLDSNWITYAPCDGRGFLSLDDLAWIDRYWSGEPYPGKDPIWETIFDGRMLILGTGLRKRAYEMVKRKFPNSLGILEIARLAAWVGSDLGDTCASLTEDEHTYALHYQMNWKDADNPTFLAKLKQLHEEGHPINRADLRPHVKNGNFGQLPDLRPFGFIRPKQTMPYIRSKNLAKGIKHASDLRHLV